MQRQHTIDRKRKGIGAVGTLAAAMSLCLALVLAACEEKFDLATLPTNQPVTSDTSYVQIFPSFGGFSGPRAIMIGYDQLMYVADSVGNRVVMMNRAGQVLSERAVQHPMSLAQDTRLDLLVGGELVTASGDAAGAVFRFHLVSENPDSAHRLDLAPVDTVWVESAQPRRRFPGISTLPDNSYLVSRTGPDNSSFIDPDGRVMVFSRNDEYITPVPGLVTQTGTGITNINKPLGLASFPRVRDFIMTQSSEGVAYGAIWMIYKQESDFEGWVPKYDPEKPEDRGVDFIRPYRYLYAVAAAVDPVRLDVFIADAALDSVFKFNSKGRLKSETFGLVRSGGAMLQPVGLAYYERILYVLDAQRKEILRFRLTTDVPR
jgi:hypothetical protein